MKKIMMIGKTGCGKTTLSQRMLGKEVSYKKTQSIELVGEDIVDTPGEYLEQKQFYSALIVTAVEADIILLLAAATDEQSYFSPRMSSMFCGKKVYGIITKTDLCSDPERLSTCREILEMAGAERVFEIGFGDDACVEEILEVLEQEKEE